MTEAETEFYKSTTMATFTGKRVDPFNLQPEDIDIRDIAHHLSLICRFNGGCTRFYSVAEHSILVSEVAEKLHGQAALVGLLHDAAEAYLGDVIRPIKHRTEYHFVREIQDKAQAVIERRFDMPADSEVHAAVRMADRGLVLSEGAQLFPLDANACLFPTGACSVKIRRYTPEQAEERFLQRFAELIA